MLSPIDIATIAASLLLVVYVALRAAGKKASDTEYFLAGRDLSWPFVGMSLFVTNISAEHVIGLAGDAYRIGMVAGGYEWIAAWDLIILATLFAPLYLRSKVFTIPEFLEHRFGWSLRAFLSANLLLINVLTKNAIALWAGSLLFTMLFDWNQTLVILLLSAFTVLYTIKGGLRAVVYADMIQGTWLILGGVILALAGLMKVGGWGGLLSQTPAPMLQMVKPLDHELPVTGFFVSNFLAAMFYWCMDQTNVQRVLGARSIGDGQKGAIFAGFLKLTTPFILVLPGLIARVLYPNLDRYDSAYPQLVRGLLPVGLRGVVLAGLIAALTSSVSACYNSSATLVVRDFVLRFRPAISEQRQVTIGRWVTVMIAVLSVLAAPLVGLSVTIWHYLQFVSAYLSVPMSAAIFIGLLWKRANLLGALSAVSMGFATALLCFLDQTLGWRLSVLSHPNLNSFLHRSLIVWIVSCLAMVGVSLATQPPELNKVRDYVFGGSIHSWEGLADYRTWALALLVCTIALWWSFR